MSRAGAITLTTPSDCEIVMTRWFDAPRELLFDAHSSCEHVSRWWGRNGSTLVVCEMEFRTGGAWRFVAREPDGAEYGFRGQYREVVRPERIVYSFEFDGMPGNVCVDSTVFEERDGGTLLTTTTLFDSKEDRDAMLETGMEEGAGETWDRLAEYVASMRA
jgi:uncharacterized protein YndB with AHSA1/START domain